MVLLLRANQRPFWPGFIYTLIVVLIIIFLLIWLNPLVSRSYVYGIFRELSKTEMSVKTLNWHRVEDQHFIIKYQTGDENVAKMVLQDAENNFLPVTQNLNYTPNQKVQVIIYPTRESLSKSFGWDANESAMGVYWAGVIRILSPNVWIDKSEPQKITSTFAAKGPMAHEFTHLIVDYITKGNYPRWFTEGVAQYNELNITGFKLPNDHDQVQIINNLYPFNDMDDNYDNLPDQGLAYRESLVAVRYLVKSYGSDKLRQIMLDLGNGYNMDNAMKKVLGVNLEQFESNFHRWLKNNMNEMN